MVWPIPSAKEIAASFATTLETGLLRIRSTLDPVAVSRAVRSARGVFAQVGRAFSAELREVHDHQAWWGRQYMPDSADDEAMILRHASIWGIEARDAIAAVGTVLIEGTPGAPLPSGIALAASGGMLYTTTATATLGPLGAATVSARAATAGVAGNLESGIRLTTVTPAPDIVRVTVATAFAGGADAQTPDEVKAAYLQRIRNPPHGGAAFDYPRWVTEVADVLAVGVVEDWVGRGSIGIVVVMVNADGSARAPTPAEVETIAQHLGAEGSRTGVRPVTARTIVVTGTLAPVPISVRLRPDTAAVRAAVTAAFHRFINTIGDEEDTDNAGPIGATIEPSRISDAISAAAGEYAHDLSAPAARYTLDRSAFPVAGAITFLS